MCCTLGELHMGIWDGACGMGHRMALWDGPTGMVPVVSIHIFYQYRDNRDSMHSKHSSAAAQFTGLGLRNRGISTHDMH